MDGGACPLSHEPLPQFSCSQMARPCRVILITPSPFSMRTGITRDMTLYGSLLPPQFLEFWKILPRAFEVKNLLRPLGRRRGTQGRDNPLTQRNSLRACGLPDEHVSLIVQPDRDLSHAVPYSAYRARSALTAAPTTAISSLVGTTSNILPCSELIRTMSCRSKFSRSTSMNRALWPVM